MLPDWALPFHMRLPVVKNRHGGSFCSPLHADRDKVCKDEMMQVEWSNGNRLLVHHQVSFETKSTARAHVLFAALGWPAEFPWAGEDS